MCSNFRAVARKSTNALTKINNELIVVDENLEGQPVHVPVSIVDGE